MIARFGLMHICATNICVWIRTLVLESLKEITIYHQKNGANPNDGAILDSIRHHSLRHAGEVLGTHSGPIPEWEPIDLKVRGNSFAEQNLDPLAKMVQSTARVAVKAFSRAASYVPETTTRAAMTTTPTTTVDSLIVRKLKDFISTTTEASATSTSTAGSTERIPTWTSSPTSTILQTTTKRFLQPSAVVDAFASSISSSPSPAAAVTSTSTTQESVMSNMFGAMENAYQTYSGLSLNDTRVEERENLDSLFPQALIANVDVGRNLSCGRVNIMGSIVNDSAPYLYPFIIEYSLIGAVVIYVMWKHIGRYQKNAEEDLEHRLEVMLSRRAVAMAQKAQSGRVDCVGASKGLFFGLLLLVASLICLILFFVLIKHPQFSLLAIYLADCSHCAIMGLSILAILIGFCR